MSKFTLTKSNLANTCTQEDSEVLYPLTITEQVKITDDLTLEQWIDDLDIPDAIDISFHYDSGLKVATINDVDLYIPYLRTLDNVILDGIPKFDWNYFKLGTQENADKLQFDLSFTSNFSNTISVGSLKTVGNTVLTDIYVPKTLLNVSYDDVSEKIQIEASTGNYTSTASITKSMVQSISSIPDYTLFRDYENNSIVLSDGTTETSAPLNLYEGIRGINIESDETTVSIGHTNNITSGSAVASINNDGNLIVPTINYDSNGHITRIVDNELVIPEKVDTTSLWKSNALVTNYFRIPNTWVSEASYTDSTHYKYYYVPLFKVIPLTGAGGLFRANVLFEVVSRMDFNYYGKYLLNYSIPLDQYSQSLLQITKVPTVEGDTQRLNLEAYVKSELIDNISTLVITVYRKITTPVNNSKPSITADTFFMSVLGYNNPDLSTPQNSYEFYTFNGESGDSRPSSILEITYENKDDLGTYIPLVY